MYILYRVDTASQKFGPLLGPEDGTLDHTKLFFSNRDFCFYLLVEAWLLSLACSTILPFSLYVGIWDFAINRNILLLMPTLKFTPQRVSHELQCLVCFTPLGTGEYHRKTVSSNS